MQFEYEVLDNGVVVVIAGGRIDGSVAPELGMNLRDVTGAGHYRLVLVAPQLTYTSSAALRELISAWKTCRRNNRGDLVLVAINSHIMAVLNLTGLSAQFRTFNCQDERNAEEVAMAVAKAVGFVSPKGRKPRKSRSPKPTAEALLA